MDDARERVNYRGAASAERDGDDDFATHFQVLVRGRGVQLAACAFACSSRRFIARS